MIKFIFLLFLLLLDFRHSNVIVLAFTWVSNLSEGTSKMKYQQQKLNNVVPCLVFVFVSVSVYVFVHFQMCVFAKTVWQEQMDRPDGAHVTAASSAEKVYASVATQG